MYKALYLSPMIPSYDPPKTAAFFENLLAFRLVFDSGNYKILQKDHLTAHILRAGENIGQMEFYLEVDDVDALWETIKDKLEGIKARAPFDQPYRMREFHLGIPETETLLLVGQSI